MSAPEKRLTPEEYLARERPAEVRSEYLAGETFAMDHRSFAEPDLTLLVVGDEHREALARQLLIRLLARAPVA